MGGTCPLGPPLAPSVPVHSRNQVWNSGSIFFGYENMNFKYPKCMHITWEYLMNWEIYGYAFFNSGWLAVTYLRVTVVPRIRKISHSFAESSMEFGFNFFGYENINLKHPNYMHITWEYLMNWEIYAWIFQQGWLTVAIIDQVTSITWIPQFAELAGFFSKKSVVF